MVNYLPEDIYNKIKDIPEYKIIDNKVNEVKYSAKNMAEFAVNDYKVKQYVSQEKLLEIIENNCTEDEINMFKVMHAETKQDVANFKFTTLTGKLFQIYHIISFFEDDFKEKIDEYINIYESLTKEELEKQPEVTHIEYFLFKTRKNIYTTKWSEDLNVATTALNHISDVATSVEDYVSRDTLSKLAMYQHRLLLERIADIAPSAEAAFKFVEPYDKYINVYLNTVDALSTKGSGVQYAHCNFSPFAVLDKLFDICFDAREFEYAARVAKMLVNKVNFALEDRKELMKGLNFFNKDYSFYFLYLIYKWRQILDNVPELNLHFNLLDAEKFATNKGINAVEKLSKIYRVKMEKTNIMDSEEQKIKAAIDAIVNTNKDTYRVFNFVVGGNE